MKKMLIAAAAVALFSAPAFAAPEPYNVEVGSNGTFRAMPPSASSEQPMQRSNSQQATWTRAEAPTSQNSAAKAEMIQASDEQAAPVKAKKKHHKKKPASSEAPKAAPGSSQPAGQGQQ